MENKLWYKQIFGLRSLKTAVAVVIAIFAVDILQLNSPSIVATAVITAMATNIHESFAASMFRTLSTLIGVLLAIVFQLINFANPFSAGLGVLIIIVVCNFLGIKKALVLATLIFITVLTYEFETDQDLFMYGVYRMIDTMVGSIIALVVNIVLFRPKQEKFLIESYLSLVPQIEKSLLEIVIGKKINQNQLIDGLYQLNTNYRNLRNDTRYKMNEHIDIINIEELNNKFRMAISILIDINHMDNSYNLTSKTVEYVNGYYDKKILPVSELEDTDLVTQFSIVYNYEVRKVVITLKSINNALDKFVKIYG